MNQIDSVQVANIKAQKVTPNSDQVYSYYQLEGENKLKIGQPAYLGKCWGGGGVEQHQDGKNEGRVFKKLEFC